MINLLLATTMATIPMVCPVTKVTTTGHPITPQHVQIMEEYYFKLAKKCEATKNPCLYKVEFQPNLDVKLFCGPKVKDDLDHALNKMLNGGMR